MTLLYLQIAPNPAEQFTAIDTPFVQYLEVLLVLAGVLLLAYLTLRVGLPRMLGMPNSTDGPIQILARYPLEPKKTLYLVKTGSQVFLIGTAESHVAYLTSVEEENAAAILESARRKESPGKGFAQWLAWAQKPGKVD